jgi:uncharacterized protein
VRADAHTLHRAAAALLALVGTLAAPPALAQREVPYLSGRVVDEAGIVPDDVEARLEQRLAAYEAESGSQVVVLTVDDLRGDPIEDFSLRVAETWKIGRGGVDDGVIFVVARDDRRMRIEVGYGLEPELTDLESGRILDEIVSPRFRQGDFGGGVEAGVDAILAGIEGAELPEPPASAPGEGVPLGARILGMLIFVFVIGIFSLAAIATPGGGGWFLYLFLVPFYLLFPMFLVHVLAGPIAAALWLVLFPILRPLARRRGWTKRFFDQGGSRRYRRGGWGGGGPFLGGGGFGGGGFGGGGGFSGGGGSFGGGGASGSW